MRDRRSRDLLKTGEFGAFLICWSRLIYEIFVSGVEMFADVVFGFSKLVVYAFVFVACVFCVMVRDVGASVADIY